MEISIQDFIVGFVVVTCFVTGTYSLITGNMKTDPKGVSGEKEISGIKARIIGLIFIIIASLISFINFA